LWKSSKEKQHYEKALSQAIVLTQQITPNQLSSGSQRQGCNNIDILEQKRSQVQQQMKNELSLRDKALDSYASMVLPLHHDALARLQQQAPSIVRLQLPRIVVSDSFEQNAELILKAGDHLNLLKQNPAAIFGAVEQIAPTFAVQDALFAAIGHADTALGGAAKLPQLLVHFNKIKWLFDQFSETSSSGLSSIMHKNKFIECMQRFGCSDAEYALEHLYETLSDAGEMSYHHFCCAFQPSEPQKPTHEVQSIPLFIDEETIFHIGNTHVDFGNDSVPQSCSQVMSILICLITDDTGNSSYSRFYRRLALHCCLKCNLFKKPCRYPTASVSR
jgi:hypothetical protein